MDEFNKDENNRKLVVAKGEEAAQAEKTRNRDIVEMITSTEKSFYEKTSSKEAQLKSVQEKAAKRTEMRNQQILRKREEEQKADEDRINSYMDKMQRVETKKKVLEKNMRRNAKRPVD